jgi:hypothetical protein
MEKRPFLKTGRKINKSLNKTCFKQKEIISN